MDRVIQTAMYVWLLSIPMFFNVVVGKVRIPRRPLGFVYNNVSPTAPVHVEFFLNLLCPDSKNAFPVVKQVSDQYSGHVRVAVINFPLPYLRNSFLAAKGVYLVNKMADGDIGKVYDWMAGVFKNQDKFGETVHFNSPENVTVALYGAIAASVGLQRDEFTQLLTTDPGIEENTITEWKYACSRGVAGTPWFIVNGITVHAEVSWTLQDWTNLIDPMLIKGKNQTELWAVNTWKESTACNESLPANTDCQTHAEDSISSTGCACLALCPLFIAAQILVIKLIGYI